ncbi:MAG: hypothetical protein ACO1OQ_02600 [Rufibacter sp.]
MKKFSCPLLLIFSWLLLLPGCSPKEAFHFSAPTGQARLVKPQEENMGNGHGFSQPVLALGAEAPVLPAAQGTPIKAARHSRQTLPAQAVRKGEGVRREKNQPPAKMEVEQKMQKDGEPVPLEPDQQQVKRLASMALVFSLLSVGLAGAAYLGSVPTLFVFSLLLALIGGGLSLIALRKMSSNPARYSMLRKAKVGLYVSLLVALAWAALAFAVANGAFHT